MNHLKLKNIGKKYNSDKGYFHGYYEVYDIHFSRLRDSASNILEIGTYNGESLLVWRDYFSQAKIHGIDIFFKPLFNSDSQIVFHLEDAYTQECVKKINGVYDVIIDDGPHTFESQLFAIKNYLPMLASNGIFVIEDVLSIDSAKKLVDYLPDYYKQNASIVYRGTVPGADGSSILLIIDLYE